MEWTAIEYVLAGSDPLVCVQWDGMVEKWRVLDTDEAFDTLGKAMAYAETIATAETEQD